MGVYINMEMPKSCRECRFCNGQADTDYGVCAWCDVDGNARDAYTMQDCPLVPVPPHGRLIDADALSIAVLNCGYYDNADEDVIWELVQAAPTVIPASEDGER